MSFSFFFHFLIKNSTRLVACGVSFETPGRIRDNIMNESKKKKKKLGRMREREEIDQREEGVKVEGEGKEGSG